MIGILRPIFLLETTWTAFESKAVIDWQGNLTFCTRDNTLENSIGSLQDHSFAEIWFGSLAKDKVLLWRPTIGLVGREFC